MKLAASNIAWSAGSDADMLSFLQKNGFQGLEIAPTRLFPDDPYRRLSDAHRYASELFSGFVLAVCSMQSIWYGRTESIFGTEAERRFLVDYTRRALDFASEMSCRNLVFGCPKNRNTDESGDSGPALDFFRTIGEYAQNAGCVVSLEANPKIYGTNFMNTLPEAVEECRRVNSEGIGINLDVGEMIESGIESDIIPDALSLINHVHISEPRLVPIRENPLHEKLKNILESGGYSGFVSIEMSNTGSITDIKNAAKYINEVFG